MDDLISRQAALDTLKYERDHGHYHSEEADGVYTDCIMRIDQLPAAQAEIPDDARQAFMNLVYDELYSDGDNNRANRIIDAADEYVEYVLSAQLDQRWIPVEKGTPKEDGEYWATFGAETGWFVDWCEWLNGRWVVRLDDDKVADVRNVVAWCKPLDPYQPDAKCDCYHPDGGYNNAPCCWGTKEKDACSCGGDRSKCDFYPENRKGAREE